MVKSDADRFQRKLNQQDRNKLDEYLTSVRDVERRIGLRRNWFDIPKPDALFAAPKNRNMVEDLPLLYDLIALALQTDSTCIATLEIGGDFNPRDLDVNGDYHALSHHGQLEDRIEALITLETYQIEQFVRFVEKALAPQAPSKTREWVFNGEFFPQSELKGAHRHAFDNKYMVLYDHPLNDKPEGAFGPLPEFSSGVPVDGIYEVKVLAQALHRDTPYTRATVFIDLDEPFRMGIRPGNTVIGDMVHTQPIQPLLVEATIKDDELTQYSFKVPLDKGFAPRFTFENGMHDVRGSYGRVLRNQKDTLPPDLRQSKGIVEARKAVIKFGYLPQIRIHEIRLSGPIEVPSPTPSQKILLGGKSFEQSRVPELLHRFASRAYRRPSTQEESAGLRSVYDGRLADVRSPLEAYKDAIKAAMCSPAFLYLSPPEDSQSTKLSDHGIAERVAYFLTSTMPDDSLRKLADEGKLSDVDVLWSETRRLLQSDASDAFIADFLDSWLNLRALGSMPPDPKDSQVYYAAGLEPEMKQETRLFMRDLERLFLHRPMRYPLWIQISAVRYRFAISWQSIVSQRRAINAIESLIRWDLRWKALIRLVVSVSFMIRNKRSRLTPRASCLEEIDFPASRNFERYYSSGRSSSYVRWQVDC